MKPRGKRRRTGSIKVRNRLVTAAMNMKDAVRELLRIGQGGVTH